MKDTQKLVTICCGEVSAETFNRARQIRLLICDVDGVLSDGQVYIGNQGEGLTAFHVRDGYGIVCLIRSSIDVAIISGRSSPAISHRAEKLGINHVYQGQTDKLPAFYDVMQKLSLSADQVAYIGDDMIDWPVMSEVGLAVSVHDAHPLLLTQSHHITQSSGGKGAVREICDLILLAQDKFAQAKGISL